MNAAQQRESLRTCKTQLAVCALVLSVTALFSYQWFDDYRHQSLLLQQLGPLSEQMAQQRMSTVADDNVFAILTRLDISHAATGLFEPHNPYALLGRSGFEQGSATNPPLESAYREELTSQLLPRIIRQLELQIRADLKDPQALQESLRAYLMLGDGSRLDKTYLLERITSAWSETRAATPDDQRQLALHAARLFEQPVQIEPDQALIKQARQALSMTPLAMRAYQTLKDQARHLPDYHLDRRIDSYGSVFDDSGQAIPGFYTRQGWHEYFLAKALPILEKSQKDGWLMGTDTPSKVRDLHAALIELQERYLHDYATHWTQALSALQTLPVDTTLRSTEQAAMLTAADSPLIKLLKEIRENTQLQMPTPVQVDLAPETLQVQLPGEITNPVLKLLPAQARQALQRHFEPLQHLLDDEGKPTLELAAALQALSGLNLQLSRLAQSSQPGQAAFDLAGSRMSGQPDALAMLRSSASRLPQPVDQWIATLADDTWRLLLDDAHRHISQRYEIELYKTWIDTIASRYPFAPMSERDVALGDFRDFFKSRGTAEVFLERYLRPFIEKDRNHYRLLSLEGRSLPLSLNTLKQMSRLEDIRRSFFSEASDQPMIRFRLQPYSLDHNLSRADFQFGNQNLSYRHGPVIPLALQWPMEADNGIASLMVEHANGRRVARKHESGPWSLFRLIEGMQREYHQGRDALLLKATLEDRHVNYLLTSQHSPNPFEMSELRSFKLPVQL